MQAQLARTDQTQEVLTAQQSLQSIQTLLRAGLGCITYLRNLLPADNFAESYLTSASPESQTANAGSFSGSFASDSSKRNVSGFKIMTVARGYTEEADKLLDYLEKGIFDALQKQYLRSFVFAVYLDDDDPNNIVEAYTFNFQYYNIPGTDISVPVMSLGDDLMKLSISGGKKTTDPVSYAAKQGKIPTLGEVKRSLKALIKNLIQATTQMDALPRRRFATFKLYYHDHTPDDYEPPYFRAGDTKKDKWFFSTHDQAEVPEKCSIGQVQTGWHTVDLRVTSVSAYLPSTEDNNAPFCGTTVGNGHDLVAPTLTPLEEAAFRQQQVEAQRQDALDRRVVWDADDGLGDVDAEGESDEEGQAAAIWRVQAGCLEFVGPVGIRNSQGEVEPFPEAKGLHPEPSPAEEAVFAGKEEKVPRHVGQLLPVSNSGDLTQTQKIDPTQAIPCQHKRNSPPSSPLSSPAPPTPKNAFRISSKSKTRTVMPDSLPPSDMVASSESGHEATEDETVDTQMLKQVIAERHQLDIEDTEMLDMETQIPKCHNLDDDPIQSFHSEKPQVRSHSLSVSEMEATEEATSIHCDCGTSVEDCDVIMCDGCQKWSHIWCMGYHSSDAKNVPDQFICFDCRVHADQNWDLIMVHNLHPRMMEKFRDLALLRRAIKIYETIDPEGLSAFTKLIGCEARVAGQLFKRLETEGFIATEAKSQDQLGLLETMTRSQNGRFKKAPRRKTGQKQRYRFMRQMMRTKKYKDYFDPNSEAEKQLLSLSDLNPKKQGRRKDGGGQDVVMDITKPSQDLLDIDKMQVSAEDSQTQPETQVVVPDSQEDVDKELKRKPDALIDKDSRKSKKVKISIGPAVDLGD